MSLSALGRVFTELEEAQRLGADRHIPYRDSKLTDLLQVRLSLQAKASSSLLERQLMINYNNISQNCFAQHHCFKTHIVDYSVSTYSVSTYLQSLQLQASITKKNKSRGCSCPCLQNSLGGNAKTMIIGTVSPSSMQSRETLSTLNFVQRAKCIHNKATINLDYRFVAV